jgi:drug/metabolite transporter (DMT)-like permease
LCRQALAGGTIDPSSFTAVRLASGAIVLAALARARGRAARSGAGAAAATALFAYAIAFSLAYVELSVGTGALILFGAVQLTMITAGIAAGERPPLAVWLGLVVAVGGLVTLVLPGLTAPSPVGALLMAVAGVAWGVYSLRGRGVDDPLRATAGNFVRTLPLAAVAAAVAWPTLRASPAGVGLAALSGALASGLGYVAWYAALRGLPATVAALVQLAVPVLAAAGGVFLLAESPGPRLVGSGAAILGGIGIAIAAHARGAPR